MSGYDLDTNDETPVFRELMEFLEQSGVVRTLHEHRETRTMADAERDLDLDAGRIVKTIAFRTREGGLVLAALRGTARVDYARLAALTGVNRKDLFPLSPEEVRIILGVEPGSVSPLPPRATARLFIDEDVLQMGRTVYCGTGRLDRTLELAPGELVRLSGGRLCGLARRDPA